MRSPSRSAKRRPPASPSRRSRRRARRRRARCPNGCRRSCDDPPQVGAPARGIGATMLVMADRRDELLGWIAQTQRLQRRLAAVFGALAVVAVALLVWRATVGAFALICVAGR